MVKEKHVKMVNHPESLLSYWKSRPFLCVIILISGLIYNIGMLANPFFQGQLVDALQTDASDFAAVLKMTSIYLVVILVVESARAIKRYAVRRFANNAITSMRIHLYNNILHESMNELEKESVGILLSRCQSDVFQTVEGMRKLTTEIFDTLFLFLVYIFYLMLFDWKMTLFALIPIAVAIIFAFSFRQKIYLASAASRKQNSLLSSETFDLFDNALLYRINSRDEDNLTHYDDTLKQYESKNVISALLSNTIIPIAEVIALAGLIPILLLAPTYVINATPLVVYIPVLMKPTWTIGVFTTYVSTFVMLASKASHTARLFSSVERGLSAWKRIEPFIQPYQEYSKPVAFDQRDGLELKDFGISVEGDPLYEHINLQAHRGQIIALTGPIASGKSAFGKMFLQELPYEGSAVLFGKEIRDYSEGEIKGNIVYMGHKAELLTETIQANIAFGNLESVLPYLKMVSFEKDLDTMPEKEKTVIGNEGVRLSGGQQERIALARTIFHQKGLVILDDPFASVDIRTEHEIMNQLRALAKDNIVLFFSHRLSYFPKCDQVAVINSDRTMSIGTHDSLLQENRTYQELYRLQAVEVNHE